MEFTVFDRIMILSALPIEGDFTMLKTLRELREDLSFTNEERMSTGMKFDSETKDYSWNGGTKLVKKVELDENMVELVKSSLKRALLKLNGLKKAKLEHLAVAEKFFTEDEVREMMGIDKTYTGG